MDNQLILWGIMHSKLIPIICLFLFQFGYAMENSEPQSAWAALHSAYNAFYEKNRRNEFIGLSQDLLDDGPDALTKWEEPIIVAASREKAWGLVKQLIICGADTAQRRVAYFMSKKPRYHSSALHYAATYGNATVTELLLKYGADVNCFNLENETPLLRAVMGSCTASKHGLTNYKKIVNLLLMHGASIEVEDQKGRSLDELLQRPQFSALRKVVSEYAELTDEQEEPKAPTKKRKLSSIMDREFLEAQ